MSKTTAQVAQLLSASNEQLFDRYIDVKLYQKKPSRYAKKADLTNLFSIPSLQLGTTDFAIKTPSTGIKPSITVSGQFLLSCTVNQVTVTIMNMNANIDTMAYNWVEIDFGYLNSGVHATFLGEITNCYMAKPNPNGELVINAVNTNIKDLYARGDFEVTFEKDEVNTGELITTCAKAIADKYSELADNINTDELLAAVSPEWKLQGFTVGKATRHFRSPIECLAWLNSLLATYTYNTGYASGPGGAPEPVLPEGVDLTVKRAKLPPVHLSFDMQGNLRLLGLFNAPAPAMCRSLSAIGSAFLTSTESATVTAPVNPGIMPGEVIFIDPKYFKTRINFDAAREKYKTMGNLWRVLNVQFTFSTQTTNTMTLQLVNVANAVKAGEG